jgi:hypothetical protein
MGHIGLCVGRCYFTGQKHKEDTNSVKKVGRELNVENS